MTHRKLFLILLVFISFGSKAQNFSFKELPISVGLYGENGIHPGIKIGTSYNFYSQEKSKNYRLNSRQTKFGNKLKLKELFLDYNLGLYSFPNNHTGYFTNVGVTFLRTKLRKNFQLGLSFEIGYLRRANKFDTYQLIDNAQWDYVPFAGNNAMVIALSPIFAKEFANNKMRIFGKPSFQFLTYTHTWQPNASLEIGLVFNIHRN
jgi:hypothetical protein